MPKSALPTKDICVACEHTSGIFKCEPDLRECCTLLPICRFFDNQRNSVGNIDDVDPGVEYSGELLAGRRLSLRRGGGLGEFIFHFTRDISSTKQHLPPFDVPRIRYSNFSVRIAIFTRKFPFAGSCPLTSTLFVHIWRWAGSVYGSSGRFR